jgi:LPS sulfotransferase NodH
MEVTGQLGRPGEFFNEFSEEYVNPQGPDDTTHRLNVALSHATPNGVLALKLFPSHLERAARDVHLWEFFPEPVFIRVSRNDLLRQAISLARAWQTKKWVSHWKGNGAQPTYSKQDIDQALLNITNENAQWDRYFARNQITPLMVQYEDLQRDAGRIVRDIAERAGVTLTTAPSIDDSPLRIQRDSLTEQWRDKFIAEDGALETIL